MIWIPNAEQVNRLHDKVMLRTGGACGVREPGLVESAIQRASAGFGDYELYPTLEQKAAAVCCGLTRNHCFLDGNKRIGVTVMLLILRVNGYALKYTQDEMIRLGLEGAQGLLSVEDVTEWIRAHAAPQP